MSLVHNERLKLTAGYLNGIALALFAIGFLGPIAGVLYGSIANPPRAEALLGGGMICVSLSGVVHLIARRILESLKP